MTGGTDNHMLLVDLRGTRIDAARAERALHAAHIAVNRASLPGDAGSEPTQGDGGLKARHAGRHDARPRASPRSARWPAGSPTSSTPAAQSPRSPASARTCSKCAPLSPSTAHNSGAPQRRDEHSNTRMHCPFCNFEDTKVTDSRLAGEGRQVRRRRECLSCGERFTTFESPELVMPYVVKRDDRREPFDVNKLRNGFLNALQKRPVQREDIERSIEHIEHHLQTLGEREVSSRLIGDLVMEELRRLDEVAYVRFASVYRSFQDVTEFQQEIERLAACRACSEPRADVAAASRRRRRRSNEHRARMADAIDYEHMARALQLAANGLYDTAPNPTVGCVLVNDARVVGTGWTAPAGGPHAEIVALKAAGAAARGATAYVTLEPCCHTGRTGPCTKALLEAGVARVVFAGARSESARRTAAAPRSSTAAGIAVEGGVMETRGRAVEPRLLHAHAARRAVRAQQARREPRRPHGARERRRASGSRAPPRAPTCIAGALARAPC